MDHTDLLHRLQRGRQAPESDANGTARRPIDREGIGAVEINNGGPEAGAAAEIDPQLLYDLAVHFSNRHFQQDLVTTQDNDGVVDFA